MRGRIGLLAALTLAATGAVAQDTLRLETNQGYIEQLYRDPQVPVEDRKAMLSLVLRSLPERVKVYPTENYYYFTFHRGGVRYAGNIRLDKSDRDTGVLHFAYFPETVAWKAEAPVSYSRMGKAEGVDVEKVEEFLYRVTIDGRSVLFELNDLSGVRPPEAVMGPDEQFLGPVFDESGIRFFLVFNKRLRLFLYVLDETVKTPDELTPIKATDRILTGTRTGFAFYRDEKRERKILIGVFEGNVQANNYYDGPFDQLPDNFLKGDELLDAILAVAPELKGTLDRFGGNQDGSERYLIAPYMNYRTEDDLALIHKCATGKRGPREDYYECFVVDDEGPEPPAAQQKGPRSAPKAKRPPN